jgi:hypothetical protein
MIGAGDAAGAGVGVGEAAGAGAATGAGVGAAAGAPLSALAGAAADEGAALALALAFALALVLLAADAGFPLSLEFGSFAALAGANGITIAPSANKLAARRSSFDNRIVASAVRTQKNDRDRFGEDTSEQCTRRDIATRARRVTLSIRPQAPRERLPQKHPKKPSPKCRDIIM